MDIVAEAVPQDAPGGEQVEQIGEELNGKTAGQPEDNKFQKAIAAWRNIDLTTLIPTLDTAASDLVSHQRDSLVQRKDLAQKTKDFRKLDEAGKLVDIKSLLKAYQTYIDNVTNQSKAIHNAFLQVYTPLSEAPDPYPLLEASIDSLVTAEETLPKVVEENQQLQKSISKLTIQLDETEKRLEQERSTRQELEASRDEKIKSVESTWSAVLGEKQDNWEAKEKSLDEKIENQDRLLKEIKASYEVSQRLSKGEEAEGDNAHHSASAAELEIVNSELDRANNRLAEVEARNEQLRLELAQSASNTKSNVAVEDDPTFLRLQSENSSLIRKIENSRFEKDSEKRKWDGDLRALERELSTLKNDRDVLREKVHHWADYENVKRELEVLKSIEFSTGDDDETSLPDAISSQANGSTNKGETLEQLLLARNKKLSNELTVLRVSHQDLQSRLETLQEDLSSTNMELEKSRNLTVTLESDLEKVQQEASNSFPSSTMSVAGTYTSRYPHSSYPSRRGRPASPTSSIISGFDPQAQPAGTPLEVLRSGEPVGGGSGILPMITAQRDRFKKKNSELESELQKSYQTVSSLRNEISSLQKDNLNLYEKTRYVSTFSRNTHSTSSNNAYAASPNPTTIQIDGGSSDNTDNKYRAAYESHISPFAAFRGRESARAVKRMSLPERTVFQITRMVLATRTSRNLFAMYCFALHILVMIMLYYMGSGDVRSVSHAVEAVAAAAGAGPLAAAGGVGKGGTGKEWHEEGFQRGR
ncbi:Golgi membrane protein-like protein [Tothia fuscella]|uniref:Protein CASP n=1 Tax=Tothia fuscella TaxID=1048955 RepID=A0A9P4NTM5_9PEZI|nr:Golgi membrane protein-like protein [Tothia fuscella]